jgi:glycerophosphoryl diester phosphodiesterase
VDVIECDVHLTDDGALAVIHDHLLERTTDGKGLVRDYTMAELKQLDAGSWKNERFRGERIPSLEEVLELARGKVAVAVEVKNLPLPYEGIERALARSIESSGMKDDVIVISFDHRSVRAMGELVPGLLLGVLDAARPVDPIRVMEDAGAAVFCPHWAAIDPATAQEIHAAGKRIAVWTVDDPFAMAWTKSLPADAVYTNRPRDIKP